jgi:hypothetical protein
MGSGPRIRSPVSQHGQHSTATINGITHGKCLGQADRSWRGSGRTPPVIYPVWDDVHYPTP